MATRNLTQHYIRCRSAIQRDAPPSFESNPMLAEGGAGGGGGGAWDTRPLKAAPHYVETVEDVQNYIASIERNMKKLQQHHQERLRGIFGDDDGGGSHEIEILTREVSSSFKRAGAKLKSIAEANSRAVDAEGSVRRNVQRSLAQRLYELSTDFKKMQRTYMGSLKKRDEGSSLSSLTGVTDTGGEMKDVDRGFSAEHMDMLAESEAMSEERLQEIKELNKSVVELAELVQELSTLVMHQGTVLDRIDYNMDMVVDRTKKGMVQLKKARDIQASNRPLKCIAFLLVLITVMVIILIVRNKKK